VSELSKTDAVFSGPEQALQSLPKSAVLIDTNGFMIPVQFGIDIFSELRRLGFSQFLTVFAVVFELKRLAKTAKGNDKVAARVALQLAEQCQVIDDPSDRSAAGQVSKYADDIITAAAVKYTLAVLTNDAGLRQKLIKSKVSVISMRQTKRLDFITQK